MRILLFTLMLLASALPALAQLETATVLGTVRDLSGAVAPTATVTSRNEAQGFTPPNADTRRCGRHRRGDWNK